MSSSVIGTGQMGKPMAASWLRAGHPLVIHDSRPEAATNQLEMGARWPASPRAVAAQGEVPFTSLPGPTEMERF